MLDCGKGEEGKAKGRRYPRVHSVDMGELDVGWSYSPTFFPWFLSCFSCSGVVSVHRAGGRA